ncbi:hypothetical protein GEOBRER4_n2213 [Citrifermentans bremense]|uniref:Uncharacterized protein n=1 Tax=Citrifermentans bremense TaxID=60035 RepID=A0A7R7IYP4_9BACT|nr:hypothetical protein GEOBRER4_n2213 [Citrifermentans bremense]
MKCHGLQRLVRLQAYFFAPPPKSKSVTTGTTSLCTDEKRGSHVSFPSLF